MSSDIFAGIVTYNPNLARLKENLDAIYKQVAQVIIVDNGSDNVEEVERFVAGYPNVELIRLNDNYGIAKALNEMFTYAVGKANWVLTLDQDSVVNKRIIAEYSKYIERSDVNSIFCRRVDRNANYSEECSEVPIETKTKCITSGNMVRVSAWKAVGGFKEELFIDMVDLEFCYRLRRNGYVIHRVNQNLLLHELGNSVYHYFLWRRVIVYNHSAFRKYHIFRNAFYLLREYPAEAKQDHIKWDLFKIWLFTLLYESDKFAKLRSIRNGVKDSKKLK